MEKTLIGISMISEPYYNAFYKDDILNFTGLLVGGVYSDRSEGLILFPYIEKPEIKGPGRYRLRIFDSEKKNFEVDWYFDIFEEDYLETVNR